MASKKDIRQEDNNQIAEWFVTNGFKKYRSKQVIEWIWNKRSIDFDAMTNLPIALRHSLSEKFSFYPIKLEEKQNSKDGTIKFKFRLFDGYFIESVLIPVVKENRYTVCVSSQVGCSLSCKFCSTGQMKDFRQLRAAEIYDQYFLVNEVCLQEFQHPLTNVVYMGMGEPLLNFNNTIRSIKHLCKPYGLDISPRRITVSTAGIAKMIKKLADNELGINLALSLHASTDQKRNEIMPINESNNIDQLMEALHYFYHKTNKKISYEYIALKNFNDDIEDAKNLLKWCRSFPVIVNIIEYNQVPGLPFDKADEERTNRFAKYLRDRGIMATIRRSRGKDIDAACGQLANK